MQIRKQVLVYFVICLLVGVVYATRDVNADSPQCNLDCYTVHWECPDSCIVGYMTMGDTVVQVWGHRQYRSFQYNQVFGCDGPYECGVMSDFGCVDIDPCQHSHQ
jgi:hypothetical protein